MAMDLVPTTTCKVGGGEQTNARQHLERWRCSREHRTRFENSHLKRGRHVSDRLRVYNNPAPEQLKSRFERFFKVILFCIDNLLARFP